MAKQIFTWYPDEGSDEDIKPDVAVTKFEGYEQRVPIGINSEVISWNLIFSGIGTRVLPIRAFLRLKNATDSFQWTNPVGELGVYVARDYRFKKVTAEFMQVTVKFDRVYEANI